MELALVLGLVLLAALYLARRMRKSLGSGGAGGGCCGTAKTGCGAPKPPASAPLPPGGGVC